MHDARARRYALRAVGPSPARIEAPEPDAWLSILDVAALEQLDATTVPALGDEGVELRSGRVAAIPLPARSGRPEPDSDGSFASRLVTDLSTDPLGGQDTALPTGLRGVSHAEPAPEPAPVGEVLIEVRAARLPVPATLAASARRPGRTPAAAGVRRHLGSAVLVVAALALTAVAVPFFLSAAPQREVTVRLDGRDYRRTTRAATVGALLAEQQIHLFAGDRTVPPLGAALRDHTRVRVVRAFPVNVDIGTRARSVRTTRRTVDALREQLGLPLGTFADTSELHAGSTVTFRVPHAVTYTVDGSTIAARSTAPTVGDLLAERNISPNQGDSVSPVPSTPITDGTVVVVTRGAGDPAPVVGGTDEGDATWYATLGIPGTCAHLRIPMGTIVHLTRSDTGATATCRVADRGPEAWTGNLIDLSPDVFRQLGDLYTEGKVHVTITW